MQYNILVVDDDVELNLFICELLKKEGFTIYAAKTAAEAIDLNKSHDIHLILLDIHLPDANGKDIISLLRKDKTIPIIALTGQTSDYDLIVGLELGMDDYIGKPFNPKELIARIRAVLRRTFPKANFGIMEEAYIFKNFRLLPARRKLYFNDNEVHLTTTEFDYLWLFVRAPHRVLPREEILEQIHQDNLDVVDRSVDVTVMRLRRKIEQCSSLPNIIKTIRGIGYVFDEDVEKTNI
ncbi:MAG: response regulator transcription factor [Alphaproteobacteria bacterium]